MSKDGEESLQWSCARALVSQETAKMRCLNFENPPFQGFSIYLRCLFRSSKKKSYLGLRWDLVHTGYDRVNLAADQNAYEHELASASDRQP